MNHIVRSMAKKLTSEELIELSEQAKNVAGKMFNAFTWRSSPESWEFWSTVHYALQDLARYASEAVAYKISPLQKGDVTSTEFEVIFIDSDCLVGKNEYGEHVFYQRIDFPEGIRVQRGGVEVLAPWPGKEEGTEKDDQGESD